MPRDNRCMCMAYVCLNVCFSDCVGVCVGSVDNNTGSYMFMCMERNEGSKSMICISIRCHCRLFSIIA